MNTKKRVLVAMSGGIDSSVAAVMLHEQGYEVVGLTMKTWDYANSGGSKKETGCCSLDSINDARNIAVELGFPHLILDIREEFGDHVINHFTSEYLSGRTPNPCVLCNTHIKWDALLRRADKLNCEYIATGHYAKVRENNGRYIISKGKDDNKVVESEKVKEKIIDSKDSKDSSAKKEANKHKIVIAPIKTKFSLPIASTSKSSADVPVKSTSKSSHQGKKHKGEKRKEVDSNEKAKKKMKKSVAEQIASNFKLGPDVADLLQEQLKHLTEKSKKKKHKHNKK